MKTVAFLLASLLATCLCVNWAVAQTSIKATTLSEQSNQSQAPTEAPLRDTTKPLNVVNSPNSLILEGFMGGQLYCDVVQFSKPSDPHFAYGGEVTYNHDNMLYSFRYVSQTESSSWSNHSSFIGTSDEVYRISPARSTADVAVLAGRSIEITSGFSLTLQGGFGLQTYHTRGELLSIDTVSTGSFFTSYYSRTALYKENITNAISLEVHVGFRYEIAKNLVFGVAYSGSFGEDGNNTGHFLTSLGLQVPIL